MPRPSFGNHRIERAAHSSLPYQLAGAAALFAWLLSLALPAVLLEGGRTYSGIEILLQGWQAARIGVVSWYSNPLFVVAVLCGFSRHVVATLCLAGAALLAALSSFTANFTAGLAGVQLPEMQFGFGFYLWITSMAGLVGIAVLRCRSTRLWQAFPI